MKKLCVFTGANTGKSTDFKQAAHVFGRALAQHHIALVYGGGGVGLMGEIANAVLSAQGNVIGVIPQFLLDRELGHAGITELHVVNSMHERKALLAELSDGFVALPGGIGTLDELFEMWTWRRLHMHDKPIGLLNTEGYYDDLLLFLDRMAHEDFFSPADRQCLMVEKDPATLIKRFIKAWQTSNTPADLPA